MSGDGAVVDLEARLEALERLVGASQPDSSSISHALSTIETRLQNIKNRDVDRLLAMTDTAQYALTTSKFNALPSSDGRAAVIIASEPSVRQTAVQLEQLDGLSKYAEGTSFKDLPANVAQLAPVELKHEEQSAALDALTARLHQILAAYNDNVSTLSQVFMEWDRRLSEAEWLVSRLHAEQQR